MKIDLAYNPASGSFRPERLEALARALGEEGFDVRRVETTPDGVALSPDADLVCVHGGDGTVRLVARALGGRLGHVPLCVSPAGTINLIARELGYDRNPRRFAAQVARGWANGAASWTASPLVECGGQPVMACLSIGPDSAAVAGVSGTLKARIGRFAYGVAVLRLLWRWPRALLDVTIDTIDGSRMAQRAQAVFVARGAYYAGPFRLSSRARLTSPGFELVVMRRAGRLRFAALGLALALGLNPERLGLVRVYTASSASFSCDGIAAQVDGDSLALDAPRVALNGLAVRYCI